MNNNSKLIIKSYFVIATIGSAIIFLLTFNILEGYYESQVNLINGKYYIETDVSEQLELPRYCLKNENVKEVVKTKYEDKGNRDWVLVKQLSLRWNSNKSMNSPLPSIVKCIISNHQKKIDERNANIFKVILYPFDKNEDFFGLITNKRKDIYLNIPLRKNDNDEGLAKKYLYINSYQNQTETNQLTFLFNLMPSLGLHRYFSNVPTYQLGGIMHKELFSKNKLIQYSLIYCLNFLILLLIFILIFYKHFSKNKSL